MKQKKADLIGLNRIQIDDLFWNKYTRLVTSQIIPYQWEVLNDRVADAEPSHCIENFRIAAKESEGEFYGFVFQDTDLAKWLEAVAYSLSYEKNEELEKTADEAIDLIARAQQEDGYLDTYFIIKEPQHRFTNLREGHELYTFGHMMEAAVAYYEVTGKDKFLKVMEKCADLICKKFHEPDYLTAVPGHQEVEIGLIKMYQVTKKKEYLDMAREFIERRGQEPNYLVNEHKNENWIDIFRDPNPFLPNYSQCHQPVRMQKTAEGHAVRAVYMYCAMADLAYEYQDEDLLRCCELLYDNIVKRRMYITGGIGSSGAYERFTTDYDLPNASNYSESCASIGLALFCRRMAQITGKEKYIETMECALMNTVLGGIAMDGKSFFYVNPLEVWPDNCLDHSSMAHVKPVRQKWFGCACCPPNIARTLASLGEYVCFTENDKLWLNMYVGSQILTTVEDKPVMVTVNTRMPFYGETTVTVNNEQSARGILHIRIPSYAENTRIIKNGEITEVDYGGRYVDVPFGEKQETIRILFDMPAEYLYANPRVREDVGKVAVKKGPLVYCAEENDNGDYLSALYLDTTIPLTEEYEETLLGGTMTLYAQAERVEIADWNMEQLYGRRKLERERTSVKLVPYCYWGNRVPGEMMVWIKEK